MMKRFFPAVLALAVLFQSTQGAISEQLKPGEYFLVDIPDALNYHHVHSDQNRNLRISEFVPRGKNVRNWREMVTIMAFRGQQGVSAWQFADRMITNANNECAACNGQLMQKGHLGKYRFALAMMSGPKPANGDPPEWNLGLVVRGKESIYLAMKAWRNKPNAQSITQWRKILSKASICDNRIKGVTCKAD